jgi:carboxypeptidase Taq
MREKLKKFKKLINEIYDLNATIALLGWDQQTCMPSGGAAERAAQLGTLSSISHIKFTSDEMGELLSGLERYGRELDYENDNASLIRVATRKYRKQVKVPPEMVAEFAEVTSIAQHVWEEAREKSDFELFRPHLEKIVRLRRDYAGLFKPYAHIYDPLLDDYESGMTTARLNEIFNAIKPRQIELIKRINEKKEIDNSFLFRDSYDSRKQWDFGVRVISDFGYDWNRGRQDKAAHPFTTSFGLGDVRVTTRVFRDNLGAGLFSSMHEAGHAIYEQGIDNRLARTLLADGASLAVHESQSRLWENIVGRSLDFWVNYYPELQKLFPGPLGSVSLEKFYAGINKVKPSLIRVEADEATYNLHIMLRLELESALMEKKLTVKELPDAWNEKMEQYMGIQPANDAEGVLQDIHWSCGILGYFPTYALGNILSAQLWECASREIDGLPILVRKGRFSELREWLRDKIHRHGAKFEPGKLIKATVGKDLDPEPYIKYLTTKFSRIYDL